jgi:hypothetical protein
MMLPPELLYAVLRYRLDLYPFPQLIAEIIEEPDLAALRDDGRPLATRATDQQTRWHARFYEARERWGPLYTNFVMDYVARLFREPFFYQAIPTFRVQLWGNLAVGAYHRDAEYGHPVGEVNFWLPLTRAWGSNSVYLEDGERARAVSAWPGDIVVFDAVGRRHGNERNLGDSRVSFDFRCLPVRLYRESEARSVNMGCRFAPGDYYAAEPINGTRPPRERHGDLVRSHPPATRESGHQPEGIPANQRR